MIVIGMNEGTKAEYRLQDGVLTIAGHSINLKEVQTDTEQKIDIIKDGQYIANIIVPPKRYKKVQKQIEQDGETITIEDLEAEELDINTCVLQLWAIKEQIEGGM